MLPCLQSKHCSTELLHEIWEVNLTTSQLLTNVKQMSTFHDLRQNVKRTATEAIHFLTSLIEGWRQSVFTTNTLAFGSVEKNLLYSVYVVIARNYQRFNCTFLNLPRDGRVGLRTITFLCGLMTETSYYKKVFVSCREVNCLCLDLKSVEGITWIMITWIKENWGVIWWKLYLFQGQAKQKANQQQLQANFQRCQKCTWWPTAQSQCYHLTSTNTYTKRKPHSSWNVLTLTDVPALQLPPKIISLQLRWCLPSSTVAVLKGILRIRFPVLQNHLTVPRVLNHQHVHQVPAVSALKIRQAEGVQKWWRYFTVRKEVSNLCPGVWKHKSALLGCWQQNDTDSKSLSVHLRTALKPCAVSLSCVKF